MKSWKHYSPLTIIYGLLPGFAWQTVLVLAGCASTSGIVPLGLSSDDLPVNLERFGGDWYVLGHIPTRPEAQAYDGIESYAPDGEGQIKISFRFCEAGHNGPVEQLKMRGWVRDWRTQAEWRVRPFWPLALGYQILELDRDYQLTVIGHPSKNYAWVMSREPLLAAEKRTGILERLAASGYAVDNYRDIPHRTENCMRESGAGNFSDPERSG